METVASPVVAAAVLLGLAALTGCSEGTSGDNADPGILCRDGYTAHPGYGHDEDGCGPHGGVRDPSMDDLQAYFDVYPDGPPAHYVCTDGWRSSAVYQEGACSYHGGVARLVWPDGTFVTLDGPSGIPLVTLPNGDTTQIPLPTPTG